jgi:hypothetical protein
MTKTTPALRRCQSLRSRRGMASALIIMILVLLIFLAVLSLVSAAADLRLSQKRAAWNQQYFQADAGAVALVAGLDKLCRSDGFAAMDPLMQQTAIDEWFAARTDIQEYQVSTGENGIKVDFLTVGPAAGTKQGIQVSLQIQASASGTDASPITIIKWVQWQAPFDYDSENSGIWKG